MRDATGKVAFKHRKELAKDINAVFSESNFKAALTKATMIASKWRDVSIKVADMIEEEIQECLSVHAFPEQHRSRIRTNNSFERLNEENRRRTRVIRIFSNEDAVLRMVATLCIEQSESWVTDRISRYECSLSKGTNELR